MLKTPGKQVLRAAGFEVRRLHPAGGVCRPTGRTSSVLQDLRARGFTPHLIFDVGASDGEWVRLAAPVFPNARFVLFEPRPAMLPALAALAAADPRYTVVPAAAGPVPGEAQLMDWGTGSTLLPVADAASAQLRVPVVTLDAIAAGEGIPELVKLDVEGFALEVMRGASQLLGATEMFILEVALFRYVDRPILHDVVAYMAERGYLVYDVADPIRRPIDGALGLLDLCFARESGQLRRAGTAWF